MLVRASIIIAAHNEGQSLWKTIRSCVESIGKLDYEIVVADDVSDDGSVEEAVNRYPELTVHRHQQREGTEWNTMGVYHSG
jgi:glycosyltransferase involved in cell wall biosynthesis